MGPNDDNASEDGEKKFWSHGRGFHRRDRASTSLILPYGREKRKSWSLKVFTSGPNGEEEVGGQRRGV